MAPRPGYPANRVGGTPGFHPRPDAFFQVGDDAIGDPRIDVGSIAVFFPAHFPKPPLGRPRHCGPVAEGQGQERSGGELHRNGRNVVEDGAAVAACRRLLQDRQRGRGRIAATIQSILMIHALLKGMASKSAFGRQTEKRSSGDSLTAVDGFTFVGHRRWRSRARCREHPPAICVDGEFL